MPSIKVPKTPTPAVLDKKGPSAADQVLKEQINQLQTLNQYFIDGVEDKPIGNRYFIDTKKKDKNGKKIYKLVDNMRYGVAPDGSIDMSQTGFVAPYQREGLTDQTVEVEVLNHSGELISKSISMSEYNSLACTAFPDNCKKIKGMENCEVCNVVNSSPSAQLDNVLNMDQEQIDRMATAAAEAEAKKVEDEVKQSLSKSDESSQEVFDVFADGFQNFYSRYKQPITNFQTNNFVANDTYVVMEEEEHSKTDEPKKHVVVENDVITALWLGSITLLGLFIVAKHV